MENRFHFSSNRPVSVLPFSSLLLPWTDWLDFFSLDRCGTCSTKGVCYTLLMYPSLNQAHRRRLRERISPNGNEAWRSIFSSSHFGFNLLLLNATIQAAECLQAFGGRSRRQSGKRRWDFERKRGSSVIQDRLTDFFALVLSLSCTSYIRQVWKSKR